MIVARNFVSLRNGHVPEKDADSIVERNLKHGETVKSPYWRLPR